MKHIHLTAALAAAIALAMGGTAFAATSTGGSAAETVTFSGTVQSDSCSVAIGGGAAQAADVAQNATVTLPNVTSSAFGSAITKGAIAGATPFSVVLAGCPSSVSGIVATWTAANPDSNGNLWSSAGPQTVGVQLLDSAGDVMNMSSPLSQPVVALTGGAATLDYTAQYISEAAAANFEAGGVSESATLVLSYQ